MFGKLWEARSRLCRSRCLKGNRKYSLESSWRDLRDLHVRLYTYASFGASAPLEYAPKSKIQLKFVKHFHIFAVLWTFIFKKALIISNCSPKFINDNDFSEVQHFYDFWFFYRWYQNILDSDISWAFETKIVEFSENCFRKVRKNIEKK